MTMTNTMTLNSYVSIPVFDSYTNVCIYYIKVPIDHIFVKYIKVTDIDIIQMQLKNSYICANTNVN